MATLEVLSGGTGTIDSARLQNTATAANNNGSSLVFAANRTTSGLTDIASVAGTITDISQSDYKGALVFSTAKNGAPAERMRIVENGNIGIGTTDPTGGFEDERILRVKATGTDYGANAIVMCESTDGTLAKMGANNGEVTFGAHSNSDVTFYVDDIGRMFIENTTGNVGIGIWPPGSRLDIADGALTMQEMSAPSAPGANKAVLYLEDNGSGKTRLMVRFASGAAQQLAIEP